MIQINLLPDIKRQYLKSQQIKHTVIVASILLSVVVITIAALLFAYVRIVQPQHRNNLQEDIDAALLKQKEFPEASKLVTIQNALNQVQMLQNNKTFTSRSFSYVGSVTPVGILYRSVSYNGDASLLTIMGTAPSTEKVNELANNIKSATYSYEKDDEEITGKPFTSSRFSSPISRNEDDGSVSFTIEIGLVSELFAEGNDNIQIHVDASSEKLLMKFNEQKNQDLFAEDQEEEIENE